MKKVFLIFTLIFCSLKPHHVSVYSDSLKDKPYIKHLAKSLKKYNIKVKILSKPDWDNSSLHIIFNILEKKLNLPKFYIAYETNSIKKRLSKDNLIKLQNAIAVWDVNKSNLNNLHNNYYVPNNYEHIDPVILPCLLPLKALKDYTQILNHSNKYNNDISSHLPALFTHAFINNPKVILELGVRSGNSTYPLYTAASYNKASMLGVDIDKGGYKVYSKLNNAKFYQMDDIAFYDFYINKIKGSPIDIIFVDTSHTYTHTKQEITKFINVLSPKGMMIFHDSNVTPLNNNTHYGRINNTIGYAGNVNTRGVTQAIKECFSIKFNEYKYLNTIIKRGRYRWNIIHYPFCNGLTIIKKLMN